MSSIALCGLLWMSTVLCVEVAVPFRKVQSPRRRHCRKFPDSSRSVSTLKQAVSRKHIRLHLSTWDTFSSVDLVITANISKQLSAFQDWGASAPALLSKSKRNMNHTTVWQNIPESLPMLKETKMNYSQVLFIVERTYLSSESVWFNIVVVCWACFVEQSVVMNLFRSKKKQHIHAINAQYFAAQLLSFSQPILTLYVESTNTQPWKSPCNTAHTFGWNFFLFFFNLLTVDIMHRQTWTCVHHQKMMCK